MIIKNLRLEKSLVGMKAIATVVWENCNRPDVELYFETIDEFSASIAGNPHAFLVACVMPALHFGEERIAIEGSICPQLKNGLVTAMNWIRLWYYKHDKRIVGIESKNIIGCDDRLKDRRAGFFFSGGIDALSTLRMNNMHYPSDHPGSIKDGLVVCGLEVADSKAFDYVIDSLSVLARDANITLIPVYTNLRQLGPDNIQEFWHFWEDKFMGAAFSAVAHAFSKRLHMVYESSDHDIPNIYPFGSHPLLNPNYSSIDLTIRLENIALSRFERTKLVATWGLALQHLRVCNKFQHYKLGALNCGECEKCTRTMLALQASGSLEKSGAFPKHKVSAKQIIKTGQLAPNTHFFWSELVGPLSEIGCKDLVNAVNKKIAQYRKTEKKKMLRNTLLNPIIEFDETKLKGRLRSVKKMVYSKGIWN
jgi:hypothetical protein